MSAICRFLTASSADGAMAFSAGLSGQGPAMAQGVVTRDTRSGTLQFEANGYPTPSTAYGTDGSIGIFLQAEEPTDPTERANWLPRPGRPVLPRDAALLATGRDLDRRLAAIGDRGALNWRRRRFRDVRGKALLNDRDGPVLADGVSGERSELSASQTLNTKKCCGNPE